MGDYRIGARRDRLKSVQAVRSKLSRPLITHTTSVLLPAALLRDNARMWMGAGILTGNDVPESVQNWCSTAPDISTRSAPTIPRDVRTASRQPLRTATRPAGGQRQPALRGRVTARRSGRARRGRSRNSARDQALPRSPHRAITLPRAPRPRPRSRSPRRAGERGADADRAALTHLRALDWWTAARVMTRRGGFDWGAPIYGVDSRWTRAGGAARYSVELRMHRCEWRVRATVRRAYSLHGHDTGLYVCTVPFWRGERSRTARMHAAVDMSVRAPRAVSCAVGRADGVAGYSARG